MTQFTSWAFAATGAPTPRTMPDRLADIKNVKDFGALGDGSHDDTTNIQAAITSASSNGIIFFPKGTYKTTAPVLIPGGSSLIFRGTGDGSSVFGNFNGFIFDNLSSPYNAQSGVSIIEQLSISNSYTGNNFAVTAAGTWSASGSPVSITLSGSNPGVAAGGALWISDSRFATNSVFVGMITSVASWPTVTVSSAAVASGATSNLSMRVVQAYPASGSFLINATTITMASSLPAGIGAGQYYVYDYEYFLSDPKANVNLGVATWSGTTLTFTAGTGASIPSIGSSDRLWLAPVAGCVRYSSVVGATVRDCTITGFIGVTSSEDKIVANDPTVGAAQGFNITVERCIFSNPSGFSGLMGQTGTYLQNNSVMYYNRYTACWCGMRLSGGAVSVLGGQAETNYFGILIGGDNTGTINQGVDVTISSISMESNALGVYASGAGSANINAVGILNNFPYTLGGLYIGGSANVAVQASAVGGSYFSNYAIYIADAGTSRQNLKFTAVTGNNASNANLSWRIPTQSWWGTCEQCDNPALVYTYANLTGVSTNPAAKEGDEFNISDGTNGLTWGQTVTNTGTHTTHYKVRYNGTNWTVVGA